MAKSEQVTYHAISKICMEMTKAGERPSVRKIHAVLGGSFSTISELLAQWRSQQALAQSYEYELSDEFNQALFAELARVTESVREKSKAVLAEKEEQLKETMELLASYESKLVDCEKTFNALMEKTKNEQLEFEKKLAVALGDSKSSKLREQGLQEKIDLLIDKCHQAELRAVIAETKIEKQGKDK